jgi:NAD(P)-dependent dehydrogenase (short-subunit alcohol dehydrogenase family)
MTLAAERTSYYAESPVAVIIGCGDLGMACARALGQSDPLVVVDVDANRLHQAIETLKDEGIAATAHVCDISNPEQTKALGVALGKGPGVRVLAHIAALGNSVGDWRKMMGVNLVGVHLVARAVRPHMKRGAVALFMSSMGGYLVAPDPKRDAVLDDPLQPNFLQAFVAANNGEPDIMQTYCFAKRGMNRLARKLALDWGPDEVRALSVSPGFLTTAMARRDGVLVPGRMQMIRDVPLGRQGTVKEVADVVAFLCSDKASYVNGIDIPICGGYYAVHAAHGRLFGGAQNI